MLYHMKLVFSIDLSSPTLNKMTELIDGSHTVLQNAMEFELEQTVPFIPDNKVLEQYQEIIKKGYESDNRHIENIRFVRYDFIEPIPETTQTETTMSAQRAKQIIFEILQLFRRKAESEGRDPKDFDDWLFSELDMEIQELEEIYAPYSGVTIYGASCYETGQRPKNFDVKYFTS